MNIKKLHTELLKGETKTDGHSPLQFICNDKNLYYCKYLPTFKQEEINCLAYEVVAHYLLRHLNIPTPDIALVNVAEGTLDTSKIVVNKRLKVGETCFGSKALIHSFEIQSIAILKGKSEFNKLLNPEDLVRIAIFDLWVNNTDRGRNFGDGFNYNLLLNSVAKKQQIVAFDHAFIFGGINDIGIFSPHISSLSSNKLHLSPYYQSVVKYIDDVAYIHIVEDFVHLLAQDYDTLLTHIIQELDSIWDLSKNLQARIVAQLSDKEQLQQIKNVIIAAKK